MIFSGLPKDAALRPMWCYVYRSRFHFYQALCFGLEASAFREDELLEYVHGREICPRDHWARRHPESVSLLVDREQCTEMRYLQRMQLPYAIYILEEQIWLDGLSNQECPPPDRPVLLRGSPPDVDRFRAQCPWVRQYNDQRSQEVIEKWLAFFNRDLRQRFLQRRLCLITFGELLALWPEISRAFALQNQVFVKTVHKQRNGFGFVCVLSELQADAQTKNGPWEWQGVLDADELCLISEPLDLAANSEYRCFIIDGKLSSVSRQFDFEIETQEETVAEFARQVAAELAATGLARSYALDLAALPNGQLIIVELNEIGTCGRYVNNRFDWMVNQLYGCELSWTWMQYAAFQAAVDVMGQLTSPTSLREKAERRLAEGELGAAEAYFREYLSLGSLSTFDIVGSSLSLSQMLRGQARHAEALQIAQASVAAAQRSHQDEQDAALLVSLHEQARCLINLRNYAAAQGIITRVHQYLATWLQEDPVMQASLAVLTSECHVGLNELDLAEQELRKAEQFMEPFRSQTLSNSLEDLLADWWSVMARLKLTRGDNSAARAAWQQVVEHRQQCVATEDSPLARIQLSEALADLQAVCRMFGDTAAAHQAETLRRAILEGIKARQDQTGSPLLSPTE